MTLTSLQTTLIATAISLIIYSCNFSAGSYPHAEKYEINYSEEKVKAAIYEFKQLNPQYKVPKVKINNQGSYDLIDELSEPPSHWFIFYFYYKNENKIILTWTRSLEPNKTTFAFVSINEGLSLGNWKDVNNDFDYSENLKEKEIFENRILKSVKNILSQKFP